MPRHKKWIDKKHSRTFRLVPQSQNVDGEEHSIGQKEEEYKKCGIYFADGYNYMKHLKPVNEVTGSVVEKSIIRVPQANANLPTNVFEANGYEINADLLKKGMIPSEMRVDTSLIEELAGDEFENPTGDLDDDFVLQASGGELPVLHPPVPFTSKKNEFREKCACSDDYSDDEMEYNSDYEDDQIDDDKLSGEDRSMTLVNKGEMRPIDEQFDKLCDEYSETDDEETDEDEKEFLLDPNSNEMTMLAADFKNKKVELVLQKNALVENYPETDEEEEKVTIFCPRKKKARWDCETVVSSYTNIYNRPTLIVDSSNKQKLKSVLKQMEKMDCSTQPSTKSTISKLSTSTVRKRGETTEERKRRKAEIKMIRAERRAEKKCNKLLFKEEKKKAALCCRGSNVKLVPTV